MTTFTFEDATREQIRLKAVLHGPGGSGKTYDMLAALHALAPTGKIAVIDTERGRSAKYVGVNGWAFKILKPRTFSPVSLTEILAVCAEQGFEAVGIDSWSQYWSGADGMLERVDKSAEANRGDKFGGGWKIERPIERRMMDAILAAEFHVVATLRVKTDYVMEQKARGEGVTMSPRKVGLKPEQRDSFEYEFDLVAELDAADNTLTVTKTDLVTLPQGTSVTKPDAEFWERIAAFCSEGFVPIGPAEYRSQALSVSATRPQLGILHETVTAAGLAHAAVMDAEGNATTLGELILNRALTILAEERRQAAAAAAVTAPPVGAASTTGVTVTPLAREAEEKKRANMAGWVNFALKAGDVDTAAANDTTKIQTREWKDENIIDFLTVDVRERLGVRPDEVSVSFAELGPLVVEYTGRHKQSPLATLDDAPPAPVAALVEDVDAEVARVAAIHAAAGEHRAKLAAAAAEEEADPDRAVRAAEDAEQIAAAQAILDRRKRAEQAATAGRRILTDSNQLADDEAAPPTAESTEPWDQTDEERAAS